MISFTFKVLTLRNKLLHNAEKFRSFAGGDWGSIIGANMATLFPENVLGKLNQKLFNAQILILRFALNSLSLEHVQCQYTVDLH